MPTWLELRRLRYFVAIYQHGSVSEASRQLNIAQPALSHHLRAIETDLGTVVFVRRRHGVELTEAGTHLLGQAQKVLKVADEAQSSMLQYLSDRQADIKVIRLAIIASMSSAITTKLLSVAAGKLPGHRLHIQELSARESGALIEAGKLDFSITLSPTGRTDDDILANEELYYVYSPTLSPMMQQPISMDSLAELPLILPSKRSSRLRDYLDNVSRMLAVNLKVVLEIDGLVPRKESVVGGLGGTLLPLAAIMQEVAAGTLAVCSFAPRLVRPIILEQRQDVDPALALQVRDIITTIMTETGNFTVCEQGSPCG